MDKIAWPKAIEMHLILVNSTRLIVETCWSERPTISSHKSYLQQCQPSSHLLRIQHNADQVWEPEAHKLMLFSPFDLKGSLHTSQQLTMHYPSILNYIWHNNTSTIQIISIFLWTTCATWTIITICSKILQVMCTSCYSKIITCVHNISYTSRCTTWYFNR